MTAQVRYGGAPVQLHADKAYDIAADRRFPRWRRTVRGEVRRSRRGCSGKPHARSNSPPRPALPLMPFQTLTTAASPKLGSARHKVQAINHPIGEGANVV